MKIELLLKENSYKIYINELEKLEFNKKVFILTSPKIAGLHLTNLLKHIKAKELFVYTITDTEEFKTLNTVENILNQMLELRLNRDSILINFGGGIISDIGGFTASIYKRSISFINIPTTLLACIDASTGGKTGVNSSFGKNLIGSFYQPKAVYIQTDFLKSLDKTHLSAAMAEFIKVAVMFDASLLDFIENINLDEFFAVKTELFEKIIYHSISLKAQVVSKDEKENNLRMLLNYGHSFAHIIEKLSNYSILHGNAVSIGINMANYLALQLGYLNLEQCQRVENILKKFNLPVYFKIANARQFYDLFFLDKKSLDSLNFILASKLGQGFVKSDIAEKDLLYFLENF